jgi:hypothetical protein
MVLVPVPYIELGLAFIPADKVDLLLPSLCSLPITPIYFLISNFRSAILILLSI